MARVDPFLIAMIVAIGLAALAPELGSQGGLLAIGPVTQAGIALVFFLHGAALSRTALGTGARNWRLHLLIQCTTFVLFPMVGAGLYFGSRALVSEELAMGLFYLCALSSTISSSVATTALARGDVAAAVFNATLSGLLGMMLTPLLVGLMDAGSQAASWSSSFGSIALKLFLPFALGHGARPWLADWLRRRKGFLSMLDRSVIVLIVYGAFCDSIVARMWSQHAAGAIFAVFLGVALLLAMALAFIRITARHFEFRVEHEIAALFCGSQKSLANGAPMAKILFGSHPGLAMIVLPLLMYHQLQILVCSALAHRYAVRR